MSKQATPSSDRMSRMPELRDNDEIRHKYRKDVVGVILIRDDDYIVKWSDAGGDWEKLHGGDFGGMA